MKTILQEVSLPFSAHHTHTHTQTHTHTHTTVLVTFIGNSKNGLIIDGYMAP